MQKKKPAWKGIWQGFGKGHGKSGDGLGVQSALKRVKKWANSGTRGPGMLGQVEQERAGGGNNQGQNGASI